MVTDGTASLVGFGGLTPTQSHSLASTAWREVAISRATIGIAAPILTVLGFSPG